MLSASHVLSVHYSSTCAFTTPETHALNQNKCTPTHPSSHMLPGCVASSHHSTSNQSNQPDRPPTLCAQDKKKNNTMAAVQDPTNLLVKETNVMGTTITVVRLPDRRLQETSDVEWSFQSQLESLLYDAEHASATGAMYHLLKRTDATAKTLPLKKSCISTGIVTLDEFQWLRSQLSGQVRSFTLVPRSLLEAALATYGRCEKTEALITALGLRRPDEWGGEEEGEDGEEEGKEDGEGGGKALQTQP